MRLLVCSLLQRPSSSSHSGMPYLMTHSIVCCTTCTLRTTSGARQRMRDLPRRRRPASLRPGKARVPRPTWTGNPTQRASMMATPHGTRLSLTMKTLPPPRGSRLWGVRGSRETDVAAATISLRCAATSRLSRRETSIISSSGRMTNLASHLGWQLMAIERLASRLTA